MSNAEIPNTHALLLGGNYWEEALPFPTVSPLSVVKDVVAERRPDSSREHNVRNAFKHVLAAPGSYEMNTVTSGSMPKLDTTGSLLRIVIDSRVQQLPSEERLKRFNREAPFTTSIQAFNARAQYLLQAPTDSYERSARWEQEEEGTLTTLRRLAVWSTLSGGGKRFMCVPTSTIASARVIREDETRLLGLEEASFLLPPHEVGLPYIADDAEELTYRRIVQATHFKRTTPMP